MFETKGTRIICEHDDMERNRRHWPACGPEGQRRNCGHTLPARLEASFSTYLSNATTILRLFEAKQYVSVGALSLLLVTEYRAAVQCFRSTV